MRQRDLQTREIEDDSSEHPAQPRPPVNRRTAASGAVAALLALALGVATFAMVSAYRPTRSATGASNGGHANGGSLTNRGRLSDARTQARGRTAEGSGGIHVRADGRR